MDSIFYFCCCNTLEIKCRSNGEPVLIPLTKMVDNVISSYQQFVFSLGIGGIDVTLDKHSSEKTRLIQTCHTQFTIGEINLDEIIDCMHMSIV